MIPQVRVYWLMILLLLWSITAATSSPDVKPGCQEKCGDVSVPYPFGIDSHDCALNDDFFLNCSNSGEHRELLFGPSMAVRNISLLEGIITASVSVSYECYDKSGRKSDHFDQSTDLGLGSYVFSDSRNIFTVIGCDTMAVMANIGATYGAACLSFCAENVNMSNKNTCSGSGCCQTSIPKGLKSLEFALDSFNNYTNVSEFNLCGYGFLADKRSINLSDWQLSRTPNGNDTSDVAIEWIVKNETCEMARADASTYACGSKTNCTYSENGQGYRCLCNEGFAGNPYLEHGCQDIDECNYPQMYPCKGRCENTIGNYTCHCPLGMHGDGKRGCQGFSILTTIAAIAATVCFFIIGLQLCIMCKKRKKYRNFKENGGIFLKHQRVKIFSEVELAKATCNYDDNQKLGEGGFGFVYRGVLSDNTLVAVKKSKGMDKGQMNEDFQHEIGIVSQVNHKNVVKLMGLCLETRVPLLVYEFIPNGTLFEHIHDKRSQVLTTWISRLRIASEIALALDYLHSLADPPIIHGDVKSVNILLDNNYTAKIADFGASVLISPDQQTNIATKIQGTFGYLDPEYLMMGKLTAKSDVYSFGVVLLELLTGEKPLSTTKTGEKRSVIEYFISALENNNLFGILDFQAADESEMGEIEVVAELAKRCVNSIGINRPPMKEVSHELARLTVLYDSPWVSKDSEETEYLLSNSSVFSMNARRPEVSQSPGSQKLNSLQIESYTHSI